jgi:hypothetical protein
MITRAAMAMPGAAPRSGRVALLAVAATAFARAIPARDRGAVLPATLAALSTVGGAVALRL